MECKSKIVVASGSLTVVAGLVMLCLFVTNAPWSILIPKAVASGHKQQCLQLPLGFSAEDFKAALQLGRELRIKKGLSQCSPGPAAQALENLGRCWNLSYCLKVVTPSVRKIMGCPSFKKGSIAPDDVQDIQLEGSTGEL